jgi:hypothetical protein
MLTESILYEPQPSKAMTNTLSAFGSIFEEHEAATIKSAAR